MDTANPNQPSTATESSPSPRAHFPGSGPRPSTAEAQRILADKTVQVRQGRKAQPPEPSNPIHPDLPGKMLKLAEMSEQNPPPVDPAEAKRERDRREALEAACGVPTRYRGAGAAYDLNAIPPDARPKYEIAIGALAGLIDKPAMVALIGTRGTGKTWMGCGLVLTFCRRGKSARFADAMDYFLELKATYDDGAKRDQRHVEADYLKPELLVLDEVHERGDTAWEDRMLTRLINKRYAAELSTVLISNQSAATFGDRIGPSIADRIHDGGGVIVCDWPSLRGRINR